MQTRQWGYLYQPASNPLFPNAAEFDDVISATGASSVLGSLDWNNETRPLL